MVIISEERYASLAHYNVKGSKWYKHKFGKWQNHAKYAAGKAHQEDENKMEGALDSYKKQDVRLSSGTKAYRVQREGSLPTDSYGVYVTLTRNEAEGWLDAAGEGEIAVAPGKLTLVEFKIPKEVVIPSYKKTIDLWITTQVKNQKMKDIYQKGQEEGATFVEKLGSKTVETLGSAQVYLLCKSNTQDPKKRRPFFNALLSEGYNAIVDRASWNPGATPIIYFGNKYENVKIEEKSDYGMTDLFAAWYGLEDEEGGVE